MSIHARAETRNRTSRFIVLLLAGLGALTVAGCQKKATPGPKTLQAIQWQGLRLGMSQPLAEARLKALGWKYQCKPANTVVYMDGNALLTRWIKRDQRKRAKRCDAIYRPQSKAKGKEKGAAKGKATGGRVRAKLFFLDGTLRQMNIVLERSDATLSKELSDRWGKFQNVTLDLYLYASPRPGQLRALSFRRGNVTALWLRKIKVHELIFLRHSPEATRAMRAIATSKKDG